MDDTRRQDRGKAHLKAVLVTAFACGAVASAQAPSTDILLVALPAEPTGVTTLTADEITYLTDNDRYDNQPSFTPDGSALLYVAADEAGQTDIYRYTLATGEAAQVTDTPASEFSPQVTPDGEHITAVRIEADGVTQRLWRFGLGGGDAQPSPEDVYRVGYYAFADPDKLALVRVDEETNGLPLSLHLTDLATGETQQLAGDVGVGVQKVPGQDAVSYVRQLEDGTSTIEVFNVTSGETRELVATLPEIDAHTFLPDGSILAAEDTMVYRWREGQEWTPYLDFSEAEVSGVGRLAVSPDGSQLAFVISKDTE